jgi:hypothetical protein
VKDAISVKPFYVLQNDSDHLAFGIEFEEVTEKFSRREE